MRSLALIFSLFFSLAVFGQQSINLSDNSCYESEFVDQKTKHKYKVYVFFSGAETAYVLKARKALTPEELEKVKEDYSNLKSSGVYKVYGDTNLVVRTNNSKDVKAHKAQGTYSNLKGILNAKGELICTYSDQGNNVENLTFKLVK